MINHSKTGIQVWNLSPFLRGRGIRATQDFLLLVFSVPADTVDEAILVRAIRVLLPRVQQVRHRQLNVTCHSHQDVAMSWLLIMTHACVRDWCLLVLV